MKKLMFRKPRSYAQQGFKNRPYGVGVSLTTESYNKLNEIVNTNKSNIGYEASMIVENYLRKIKNG